MTDDRAEAAYRARERYAERGDPEAAREAVELLRVLAREEHVAAHVDELGGALLDLFEAEGEFAVLAEALEAHEEHVRLALDADSLNNLGNCLRVCHDEMGDEHLLERAREVLEEAAELSPGDATVLDNLGLVLTDLYDAEGKPALLDRALELHTRAVLLGAAEDPNHLLHVTNLASAHMYRYDRAGDPADLDAWAEGCARAVALTPAGSPNLPLRLANLALALLERHARHGSPPI